MTSSTTQTLNSCLVCGDKAIGFNFGVLTCMPCKAFFRRNAVKLGAYEFICSKDGDCPITHKYRRLCNCCRLAKCFRVGMKKGLILTEAEKQARRKVVVQNRRKRDNTTKTKCLDLIRISHVQPLIHNQSSCLTLSDKTLLRNIFNTYELTCMTIKNSYNYDFPLVQHTNLFTYLNEYSCTHKILIEYFKIIPEFHNLSIKDKIYLIRNQFGVVNNINEAIIHPGISTNLTVSLINVFGVHLANRLLQCIDRIQLFTYDPLILKILLIIVAFSIGHYRNCNDTDLTQVFDNTVLMFSIQNIYVEILWKYILSNSSNELYAVKFFDKLIQFVLYLLDAHLLVDDYINNLPSEIEQMNPLMQSMWPKTNNI